MSAQVIAFEERSIEARLRARWRPSQERLAEIRAELLRHAALLEKLSASDDEVILMALGLVGSPSYLVDQVRYSAGAKTLADVATEIWRRHVELELRRANDQAAVAQRRREGARKAAETRRRKRRAHT